MGAENDFNSTERLNLVACAHHRAGTLHGHGTACQKFFHKFIEAPTVKKISQIRSAHEYVPLSDSAKEVLDRLPDEEQYSAATVATESDLYEKMSSQVSEVDNNAIKPAHGLDPVGKVQWHGERAVRFFTKIKHESRTCDYLFPPKVKTFLDVEESVGQVSSVQASFTAMN